jgi:HTH-type transcriptional regulator/antitoxin HigA
MGNVFDKDGHEIKTIAIFHPGEFLLEEIKERGLKKTDFAAEIKMLPGNLSELFSGKRNITAIIAVRLEKELGISAEYWIGLQTAYDLSKAREIEHA